MEDARILLAEDAGAQKKQGVVNALLKKDLEEKGKNLRLCGGLCLLLWGKNSHGT